MRILQISCSADSYISMPLIIKKKLFGLIFDEGLWMCRHHTKHRGINGIQKMLATWKHKHSTSFSFYQRGCRITNSSYWSHNIFHSHGWNQPPSTHCTWNTLKMMHRRSTQLGELHVCLESPLPRTSSIRDPQRTTSFPRRCSASTQTK